MSQTTFLEPVLDRINPPLLWRKGATERPAAGVISMEMKTMLEVVIPNGKRDFVEEQIGKFAIDWREEDQTHEETVICFYFDNDADTQKASQILDSMEQSGVRYGEH